ncbi:MAG TPA: transketolase [Opitutales bacterium]|nr:transketolase [Opitutales bacterium]
MYLNEIQDSKKRQEELSQAAERLRWHSLEITSKAGSGHPTSSLSCAEIVSVLFFQEMQADSSEPENLRNDRFVLSKGHAAPVLWSVHYEAGLIDKDELRSLRRIDSDQEGHPTPRNPWVDVATGSLGQGLSMGLGMAWSARLHDSGSHTYVLLGDGETAEGSVWEAANLAAFQKVDNLTAIVDINRFGQSGPAMLEHDLATYRRRFEAFGWEVSEVDGHDVNALSEALQKARSSSGRPHVILAETEKGHGVSSIEGEEGSHGKPAPSLKDALSELDKTAMEKECSLGIHPLPEGDAPSRAIEVGEIPKDGDGGDEVATRQAFGDAALAMGKACNRMVALDGDVKNSTKLEPFFEKYPERSIECYIAEQNMVGMATGISKSGMLPCVATFAAFLTRAMDQLRMAAISQSKMILAGSHAGVAIGEDGPTQMGLEDLSMMRALPGSQVFYPADVASTRAALEQAAGHDGISYLRLNRGKTPQVYPADESFEAGKAKVFHESKDDDVTLIGGGITLHECLKARENLEKSGIKARVVDPFSVKPIDAETLRRCADETGTVIVAEDHYGEGGLGEAVLSALEGREFKWSHLAVRSLPRSGDPEALLERHGISHRKIENAAAALAA